MQRRTTTPRHAAHTRQTPPPSASLVTDETSDGWVDVPDAPSEGFDFSRLLANLSPIDVLAILGFFVLGLWTLWFGFQCLFLSMYIPMVIAFVAAAVFLICSCILTNARVKAPYEGVKYDDVLYETNCYIQTISVDPSGVEDESSTKACTIYCRRRCLTLNFNDAWRDDILWSNVHIVKSFGAKTLILDLPKNKGRIQVKFLFDTADDRMNIEQCIQRFQRRSINVPEVEE